MNNTEFNAAFANTSNIVVRTRSGRRYIVNSDQIFAANDNGYIYGTAIARTLRDNNDVRWFDIANITIA